ncbi:Slp family lipoprotein [Verrucomicrobium sp. 3C]|uniref:Slp family lipoprotein n=1 Tax=Verrucomicrobium sp. 3C TaxID=1134055 RepID=UPI00036C3B21|nr:Slp family lipoprotein [Verrucomicrobium sp. 3C]
MGNHKERLVGASLLIFLLFSLPGCANLSPLPESLRHKAKGQPLLSEIASDPAAYQGRIVIFGGRIIETRLFEKGSIVLLSQRPLSAHDVPLRTAESGGRILVEYEGRLDPAVYSPGKRLTVAGRLLPNPALRPGPTIRLEAIRFCLWPHEPKTIEEEQNKKLAAYGSIDEYGAIDQYWNPIGWEPDVMGWGPGWW